MDTLYISVAPGLSPAFGEAKQSRRSHTAGPPQKSTPLSPAGVSTTHKAFQVKHNHLTKERSMLQANPHHQKLRRASSVHARVKYLTQVVPYPDKQYPPDLKAT